MIEEGGVQGSFRRATDNAPTSSWCVPHYLTMSVDGNVVLYKGSPYDGEGTPVWSTRTSRKPKKQRWWHGAERAVPPRHELRLRRDGVLVVVDLDRSKLLWKSTGKSILDEGHRANIDRNGALIVELGDSTIWHRL